MCGICGKLSTKGPVDPSLMEEMCVRMAHRGPDDQGIYVSDSLGLGNRRLAIQDLSPAGHMPMSNNTGSVWITYNGEVYNFRELRNELQAKGHQFRSGTDTEVVLRAYLEWGPRCLERFNGIFAFAIWDTGKQQLFLARDRMGIKPLYYSFNGSTFSFASETKVLLADMDISREIDPQGLVNYFTFGHAVAPDTIFQEVKKLLPGHYMMCSLQKDRKALDLEVRQYWAPPVPIDGRKTDLGEEYYSECVYQLLEQSVRRQLVADVLLVYS
jgi:asparagine synthase (glutamine-hydrolysing)